jgi:hypothetical protein
VNQPESGWTSRLIEPGTDCPGDRNDTRLPPGAARRRPRPPGHDPTGLRGANATLADEYDVPNGTYTTVFVHLSDVEGTLENGGSTRVKLPSGTLQVNKGFTVGNGSSVEFVFDVTVHKGAKSGMYILRPVVDGSGTDVPIESVDRSRDHGVTARFVGDVTPGRDATVTVIQRGRAESATVTVDGGSTGRTIVAAFRFVSRRFVVLPLAAGRHTLRRDRQKYV